MKAPVVLFAYNRPHLLEGAICSLRAADGAATSELFIFVDGPRTEADAPKVSESLRIARGAAGFGKVHVKASERNRGLAASVISGVSEVMAAFGRAIVLEDDLRVTKDFLIWMNDALDRYGDCERVFSVCGYTNRVGLPDSYPYDGYFCPRNASWGWGTWQDRWESVDWRPSPALVESEGRSFDKWGGSDCRSMLLSWMRGDTDSWAVRFNFNEFLQGKVSLFPVRSHVDPSAGFDGSGTHCRRYSRFKFDLVSGTVPGQGFSFPGEVEVVPSIRRSALSYHGIPARAWSRLMYLIHD